MTIMTLVITIATYVMLSAFLIQETSATFSEDWSPNRLYCSRRCFTCFSDLTLARLDRGCQGRDEAAELAVDEAPTARAASREGYHHPSALK